jgi:cellulose biosynthesis protein BcsQ
MSNTTAQDVTVSAAERLHLAVTTYLESHPINQTIEFGTVGEAGSAGKTTIMATWGALLAMLGFTVELVDLDGQGNLSKHFGIGVTVEGDGDEGDGLLELGKDYGSGAYPAPLTLGDALTGRKAQFPGEPGPRLITLDDIRRCAYNELGIPGYGVRVPSGDETTIEWLKRIHIYPNGPSYITGEMIPFYVDEAEMQAKNPMAGMVLKTKMDKVATTPHFRGYDIHGTKSMSMMSALIKMKRAINAVVLDDKTTGPDLDYLIRTIDEMKEYNEDLKLAMILVGIVDGQMGNFGRKMLDRLRTRHRPIVPDVEIRKAVTVREAYYAREPLPLWVPNAPVTNDFRLALAWAFENGVFTIE